jgi:hypothetical protein
MAVSRAVKAGRVDKSVARDATGKAIGIFDPEAADREWAAVTKDKHVPHAVQDRQAPALPGGDPEVEVGEDGQPIPPRSVSAARKEAAEARLAELKLALEEAKVIPAQNVEVRLANLFTQCKTKLLGVPSRARQQDPGLTASQLALLEGLIRGALEGLAEPDRPLTPAKRKRQRAEVAA